jgi:hypothetical protein
MAIETLRAVTLTVDVDADDTSSIVLDQNYGGRTRAMPALPFFSKSNLLIESWTKV